MGSVPASARRDEAIDQPNVVVSRLLKARRPAVWRMFSDPTHLAHWWGPKGFTNPVCELDFRPGGLWLNVMQGPDGRLYRVASRFLEIKEPEKIVYRNLAPEAGAWPDETPPEFTRIITLEEVGENTLLKVCAVFDSDADRDRAIARGYSKGTYESLEKISLRLLTPRN
jgi:uncharacterized protein YndB with AHSA1/START domain